MTIDASRIPVIAGIGEVVDREGVLEPRSMIAVAARQAASSAPALLGRIDEIDVIAIMSWRYRNIAQVVAGDLGATPRRAEETAPGGEKPIRQLGEAAARIASGAASVVLIAGAEATKTRSKASQTGETLDWGPTDEEAKPLTALDFVTPLAARYGLVQPTQVYPLYENASRHAWHQSRSEADHETGQLWARSSEEASSNPYAWLRQRRTAEEITEDALENRLIAWPYRKLMVANPMVNQGAAILVTSLAVAREAGIAERDMVFVGAGTWANEPEDFLARDRFDRSAAQDAVLQNVLSENGLRVRDVGCFELYSCFPVVPKMARRTLGLAEDVRPSMAGGLTFFGGPANNYMTHAIAAAVRALRNRDCPAALLYGQGEFVTKHAAIVLNRTLPTTTPGNRSVQGLADRAMVEAPRVNDTFAGVASIETFTVLFDRAGKPTRAPILVRTPDGERVVAEAADECTIWRLVEADEPIGLVVRIERSARGQALFSAL